MATPMQDPSQGPSWLRNSDPLGIGLRQRARDYRSSISPSGLGDQGPLRDPMWEGLFQAMDEQGVEKVADNSVGAARGMWGGGGVSTPTFDPRFQHSAGSTAADVYRKNQTGELEHAGFNFQPRPSTNGIGANMNPGFSGFQPDKEIDQFGHRPKPPVGASLGNPALNGLMGAR